MCFYILAPASRLVNWWRGTPAWSAARLVEEQGGDEHPPPPDPARAALVASLLRLHGDGSLSAATAINPEFQWWVADLDAPGVGLEGAIPFVVAAGYGRRVSMAVGDPVADPAHWPALAAAFIAARPDAQFWHASAAFAGVLDKLGGFYVNDFGAETVIDLRVRRGEGTRARACAPTTATAAPAEDKSDRPRSHSHSHTLWQHTYTSCCWTQKKQQTHIPGASPKKNSENRLVALPHAGLRALASSRQNCGPAAPSPPLGPFFMFA